MLEETHTLPEKSRTVQKRFISLISLLESDENSSAVSATEITDALERFALWAGNLGAMRDPTSKLSLEHRLAEAPEIRVQIHRQLNDLLEAIDDVASIVQGKQVNRDTTEGDIPMEDFVQLEDDQEEPFDEIRMNLELISESLNTLFRIAVLVRKATPDNRFERAIYSSNFVFPHTFDIGHVREKYPKLKTSEQSWLAERLGKAIARRRQFIKYCRDHRARLAIDDENIDVEGATTVLQSSKATTLQPEKMDVTSNFAVDDYEDDLVSILTTSTTTDILSTLELPRLVDLSKDGEPFECPICFTLRSIRGERSWRLHAFHDLKPYSCTFSGAECELLTFQDRDSWFQHELDCHRSQYACSLCKCGLFLEKASLRLHIINSHGQFLEHQLQTMEDAGRKYPMSFKAQSCPFCDDWSMSLQAKEKSISQGIEGQRLFVRANRFKRHVAAHLEQLAIFAIPRAIEKDNAGYEQGSVTSFATASLPESAAQEEQHVTGEAYSGDILSNDEDWQSTDEEQDDALPLPEQHEMNNDHPKKIQTRAPINLTTEGLTYDHFEESNSSAAQDDTLNSSEETADLSKLPDMLGSVQNPESSSVASHQGEADPYERPPRERSPIRTRSPIGFREEHIVSPSESEREHSRFRTVEKTAAAAQLPKIPEVFMQHVNKMIFRPPVHLADKSVEAAKWIEQMKERYARALMTMENTKNKFASWEKLITDRAAQGNPLKEEEQRQIQLRKDQQLKIYTEAHKWVEGVRKQQGSLQEVAKAQAHANQATAAPL